MNREHDSIHVGGLPQMHLRDLVMIVSTAVTMALAWGVFSTRITVIERELVTLANTNAELTTKISKLEERVSRNDAHQQDDELLIDQLYMLNGRTTPVRRAR